MALTERSRSALYQGLSTIIDDEAVQEMLSFFPARDVEQPVTTDHLRAEMADLRTELHTEMADLRTELHSAMADLRTELHSAMADLRTELRAEMADLQTELRAEMADLRTELRAEIAAQAATTRTELRAEMHRIAVLNVGTFVAFAAVLIAAVRL